jgi:hypothetical protein
MLAEYTARSITLRTQQFGFSAGFQVSLLARSCQLGPSKPQQWQPQPFPNNLANQ